MGRRDEYRIALSTASDWAGYLRDHSGLPGARANIELAQAVADAGDPETFDKLIGDGDEYLAFCGVLGLGRLLAEGHATEARLREHARDGRWRVREAAAMALQRLGDADPARLNALAATWAGDPDPLVQRAAAAAVCEPRLLGTPETQACALDVCVRATRWLAGLPAERRREDGVRVLRQALGYCWSVAVAAHPAAGLPLFLSLAEQDDRDVAWVVRENSRKARLAKLLPAR